MFVFTFVHLVNVCICLCSSCKETSQQALGGGLPEDAEESAKSDVSPTQRCQTLTIASEHLKCCSGPKGCLRLSERKVSQQSVSNFSWSQKKKTTLFNLFLKILFNFLSSSFFPIFSSVFSSFFSSKVVYKFCPTFFSRLKAPPCLGPTLFRPNVHQRFPSNV